MARWLGLLSLLLALALCLAPIRAGEGAEPDGFFKKLDLNNDGMLTRDEFLGIAERFKDRAKARQRLVVVYEKIDPQHHGITPVVFKSFLDSHRKKTTSQ